MCNGKVLPRARGVEEAGRRGETKGEKKKNRESID